MRLPNVTTRTLLSVVFGAVASLLIANAGSAFVDAWRQHARAEQILEATRINRALFEAMQHLRTERGTASTALRSSEPAHAATLADIATLRLKSTIPLDFALDGASGLGIAGVDEILDDLRQRLLTLASTRERIDAALTSTSRADNGSLADGWVAELGSFVERLEALSARLAAAVKRADSFIDQFMTIQNLGWIVRDYAGRDRLAVGNAIASPKLAADPVWQRQTSEYRARVHGAWTALLDVLNGPSEIVDLKPSLAAAKASYFGDYAPARDRIQGALLAGESPGTSARDWIAFSNPALAALVAVPTTAIELASRRAEELRRDLRATLFTQGAMAATAVLISLLGFLILTRRIILPIAALTDVMRRLARGDAAVKVLETGRRDELGEMARAVEVFKANAAALIAHGAELQTANLRFSAALDNMSQGLAMFDGAGLLVVCNRQYAQIYGLPLPLLIPGTPHRDILTFKKEHSILPGSGPEYFSVDDASRDQPTRSLVALRDGRTIAVRHQPMPEGGCVSTHQDVTEQRRNEMQIAHMAHHDALTGLANRVRFRERMQDALTRADGGESLAVLCLDLDQFKAVNDTLGHPVGDALLCAVAERLRFSLRERDMVARLGGDEFAVIQVGAEQPLGASGLARRLIEVLAEPFDIDGHHVVIGASVGIALSPVDADNPDQLLKAADLALYKAKSDGRGKLRFFETEMDTRMQRRRALELDLRKALAAGEFELFYQPLINLQSNRVSGLEALLRWNHPDRGRVSPADFIPLAEEIGLIVPLGEWVLRTACAEATTWPEEIKVAVNLSSAQFKRGNLVATVMSALAASGLPAGRLELEITESVLLEEDDANLRALHRLRAFGVRVSLDDFGTGYSSLSYLRSFPFDKIKIDQSFVRELSSRSDCMAIVRAVTELGRALGMTTTAEGVETWEQLDQLRAEGCTEAQGYLFSKPRPAREVASLLAPLRPRRDAAA